MTGWGFMWEDGWGLQIFKMDQARLVIVTEGE